MKKNYGFVFKIPESEGKDESIFSFFDKFNFRNYMGLDLNKLRAHKFNFRNYPDLKVTYENPNLSKLEFNIVGEGLLEISSEVPFCEIKGFEKLILKEFFASVFKINFSQIVH